ncbi:hypothetical protein M0R36_10815 [bacterium]|jgi:hypothetical protein|nr:hypothetical protein [bacterium]
MVKNSIEDCRDYVDNMNMFDDYYCEPFPESIQNWIDYLKENEYILKVDDSKFFGDCDRYYGDKSGMVRVEYLSVMRDFP